MIKHIVGEIIFCLGQAAFVCGLGIWSVPWAFIIGGILLVINGTTLMDTCDREEAEHGRREQPGS